MRAGGLGFIISCACAAPYTWCVCCQTAGQAALSSDAKSFQVGLMLRVFGYGFAFIHSRRLMESGKQWRYTRIQSASLPRLTLLKLPRSYRLA